MGGHYPRPHPNKQALLALTGKVKGLKGFVVVVLTIEAGMLDNRAEDLALFLQVIEEELFQKENPGKYSRAISSYISPTNRAGAIGSTINCIPIDMSYNSSGQFYPTTDKSSE